MKEIHFCAYPYFGSKMGDNYALKGNTKCTKGLCKVVMIMK